MRVVLGILPVLAGGCGSEPQGSQPPAPTYEARRGMLFIDGQPFVPAGVFFWPNIAMPTGNDPFRILRGYGFDTVVAYWEYVKPGNSFTNQPDLAELVAQCHDPQAGLRFFVDVANDGFTGMADAELEAYFAAITGQLAASPCFLGYSLDEWEMRYISAADGERVARAMRRHGSPLLIWVNFGPADRRWDDPRYPDLAAWARLADVVSIDYYPLERDWLPPYLSKNKLEDVGWFTDQVKSWTPSDTPIWFYQQAHTLADIGGGASGRMPDAVETRFMSYDVIVHGGTGLFAFTGGPLGQSIPYDHPTWDRYIRATFAEIKGLAGVLAAEHAAPLASASHPNVRVLARRHRGFVWVIAVRESDGPAAEVTLSVPATGVATVYGEDRSLPVVDGMLTDRFDRYAAHVYAIGPSGADFSVLLESAR